MTWYVRRSLATRPPTRVYPRFLFLLACMSLLIEPRSSRCGGSRDAAVARASHLKEEERRATKAGRPFNMQWQADKADAEAAASAWRRARYSCSATWPSFGEADDDAVRASEHWVLHGVIGSPMLRAVYTVRTRGAADGVAAKLRSLDLSLNQIDLRAEAVPWAPAATCPWEVSLPDTNCRCHLNFCSLKLTC